MEGAQGGRSRFENLIGPIPAVPGLKFHPTNEEVINFYLQNKIAGNLVWIDPIRTDQDIISRHPGTLQAHYPLLPLENAWWFYTTRDSKYPNNSKPKIERAEGYWKVSKGSDPIGDVGFKRVLNFREGSLKLSSTPTDWYMEEYSIKQFAPNKEDENWIIARIYQPLRRSQLISAGSLSPDLEVEDISLYFDWNNGGWSGSGSGYPFEPLGSGGTEVNGEWSGSAYYLPLDSGEGIISGSAYPFQPPGSGGTDFLLPTAEAMAKEKQKRTVADKEKKRLTIARKREENSYPVVQVFRERNTSVVIRDEQDIMRLHKDKRKAEAMAMEKQNGTVADKGKKKITTVGKGKENSCPATLWSNTARTRDTSGTRGDMSGHAT